MKSIGNLSKVFGVLAIIFGLVLMGQDSLSVVEGYLALFFITVGLWTSGVFE